MVNLYRPWSDHGGSPVLELVGEDGMTPPNAPEIYPDYDTRVVLAADYDALAAELNEQARVNGMGGSREAALLAKVADLDSTVLRRNARIEELETDVEQITEQYHLVAKERCTCGMNRSTAPQAETACEHRWVGVSGILTCKKCGKPCTEVVETKGDAIEG